ncbi:MAG: hypothetical protein LQ350_006123 [Teloschistes chrysophthalmus]|nr:MAG: hypothetical protein LQ350_006123 [Niorma chrysophthalma]
MSNLSLRHPISPSTSIDSLNGGNEPEFSRPQSVWSDSDHSDSQTKRWVAKGSKMLRKQNSRFNLSSSRIVDWVEEDDETNVKHNEKQPHGYSKHGRMLSTGDDPPSRPRISHPYDFRHLTHTQAHHFSGIHSASENQLHTQFTAIRASQSPQRKLRGIRAEDLRSPRSDPALSECRGPVTPPLQSPIRSRVSRPSSVLSIKHPGSLARSRSIDNFSQPSPRTYRLPPSPGSPPARTSSRNATHVAPDFFSEQHHATPEERALMALSVPSDDIATRVVSPSDIGLERLSDQSIGDQDLPHAITTSDDVALTLRPPTHRRSTLALADVPEEDELHAVKLASIETSRPKTADANLRHAKSFPTSHRLTNSRQSSRSRKSNRRPDSILIEGPAFLDSTLRQLITNSADNQVHRRTSSRTSLSPNGIDAGWEDDIDFCYKHEAEADCDFDWDRVSISNLLSPENQARDNTVESLGLGREEIVPQGRDTSTVKPSSDHRIDKQHLPRLQTSLPDLDFSAASSAKSSMASLRGPMTPLLSLPSPEKTKASLPSWNSLDMLNLDSSFYVPQVDSIPWTHEEEFQKVPSWNQAPNSSLHSSNPSFSSNGNDTSQNNANPAVSACPSSESAFSSRSSSAIQTRRNTSSAGSLPDLICSKNYRQYANATADQIAERMAALSATNPTTHTRESMLPPKPTLTRAKAFSTSSKRHEVLDLATLPSRRVPSYQETRENDLLSLRWPLPPQNVLLVQKKKAPVATEALMEFAQFAHSPPKSIPFPVYTLPDTTDPAGGNQGVLSKKVDLTATFGGDGTILRASSLFSTACSVPPILSFSMGTLGFLGEWKFAEFKRAFREVYMSGAGAGDRSQILGPDATANQSITRSENAQEDAPSASLGNTGWSSVRGKSLGSTRGARVLLRHRLKVSISASSQDASTAESSSSDTIHAMNELVIHRGATPHLAHIAIHINNRFLTEAVADGLILSTPTGSTAYSLSSGGSIIHPLVDSLCLTPICPRSLSFRPLVLPARTAVTLRLSEENNRGREVEISIDGVRRSAGMKVGGEIKIVGEEICRGREGWTGGVPCIMRGGGEVREDDGWVGGLNGLLKFNYPFGEEG